MSESAPRAVVREAEHEADVYRGDADRPLGGYIVVMAVYAVLVLSALATAALTGRALPERWSVQDLATLAIGGHKLSRIITKDAVTSPIRAPFAEFEGQGGPAEVNEEVRKPSGVRHSIGEMLTCPFCFDMWVVSAFAFGLVFAPRPTRMVATIFTALAGADFLQMAYARAQQSVE